MVKTYNQTKEFDLYTISMEADLPAMGTAEYKIVPFAAASRYLDVFAKEARTAENEYLKLQINDNGTITVTDLSNGKMYDDLLYYLDDGEIGDGWYHVNPVNDSVVDTTGFPCRIELFENGPARAVFKITKLITIPREMEYYRHGIRRSEDMTAMEITSYVGLSAGARFVDVETIVDNTARDHRLRLAIPTGIPSERYFANQPFAFVERLTGVDFDTQTWKECDIPEKPMSGIVGKREDDGTGLAFISAYGLHECAAFDDSRGTICVTLFRSYGKTVRTNGEDGGQIIGRHTFRYGIMPMQADTSYAQLIRIQEAMQVPVKSATIRVNADYRVPASNSYFEIVGEHICASMIKCPENEEQNQVIVRVYNMSGNDASAKIVCFRPLVSVFEVDLNETDKAACAFDSHSVNVQLSGWKIKTFRLQF